MTAPDPTASMSPEELIAVIERGIDEDERAARAWLPFGTPDEAARNHVARYNPGRVLADVAAKREIVRRYRLLRGYPERSYDAETLTEEERTRRAGYLHALEVVLADIARPYLTQETP